MPDDVSRTLIVPPNIGEDVLQERQVGRVLREQDLGGLGVAQDRSQRLIELVGDRSRKRAGGGGPVQMDDLQQPAAGFELRGLTAPPLEQQPGNHRRLKQHDGKRRDRRPAVLVPQARLPKAYVASRRQAALADSEALQLPPVEHGLDEIAFRDGNVRGPFAAENAQYDPRGLLTDQDGVGDKAAGRAMADGGFCIDHDRPVGRFGDRGETFMRKVGHPGAIDVDGRVYDRGIVPATLPPAF